MADTKKRRREARPARISATEAAKAFGKLVDRVRESRAVYIVERAGTPVAEIGPVATGSCTVAEFLELLKSCGSLDGTYLDEVEAGIKAWNRPSVPGDRWER